MVHTQSNLIALQDVASIAHESHKILMLYAIKNQSGGAANIAVLLKFIAECLSEAELSTIPLDTQAVLIKALQDLLQIAEWPRPKTPHIERSPRELQSALIHLFQKKKSMRQSVTKFCKEKPKIILPFESRFTDLYNRLEKKNSAGSQYTLNGTAAHSSPPPQDVYPDQVHKLLLDGVRSHATCIPGGHGEPELQGTAITNWHITKLCLDSGFCSEGQRVLFKVVTTTSKMTHWQELAFRVPMQVHFSYMLSL
ncbi:hypothetical protein ANO14919_035200 [Xylariales sp. No.14919]|nr:hypothetical protein ANO14919_035200 [Xylariales sp. No.14919]